MWSVINAMQITSHFLLINASFPAYSQLHFINVLKIMTFQIFEFPLEDYIAFSIEDKPLSLLLNTMGFESQIWVMNLKNGFVFICYQAALFILIVITKPIFK